MLTILALAVALIGFGFIYYLNKRGQSFLVRVLAAAAIGLVIGLIFSGHTTPLAAIGQIYVNLLLAFVVPLLLFSIIKTIISLEDLSTLRSIGAKTIGVLSIHNVLGSVIAIIVATLLGVGVNSHISVPSNAETTEVPSFLEAIVAFFPRNIIDEAANNRIIPVIIFALFIGIAILIYQDKKQIQPFIDFIEAGHHVMFSVIGMVVKFTPYAVLALIADKVGEMDLASLGSLLVVLGAVYLATLFHSFITTPAMIAGLARVNPFHFLKKFLPVWILAFSTQSSVGSISANVDAQKRMGVPERIASFAASIGTTFGMPGCAAIWPVILAIFTVNTLGLDFGLVNYLYMIVVALLVSVGTVGVPGTATITATALFAALGLPVEMIIVMTPISAIADMSRTATNVQAGGSSGVIVAAWENDLDLHAYQSEESSSQVASSNKI